MIIHATNDGEAGQIRKNIGFKGEIRVAPNLPPKATTAFTPLTKIPNELKLICIARISPEKNTLFALNVLVQFCKKNNVQKTTIIFDLFGTVYSEKYWAECQAVMAALPPNIKINFKGAIEKERIAETLKMYHFLFMPSQGENYGHSIVESFMAGRPVIISDQTPWRNLGTVGSKQSVVVSEALNNDQFKVSPPTANSQQPTATLVGWDLPLDNPAEFVKVIEVCAEMDQEAYNKISENAFEYAKQITNDDHVLEANKLLFA